MEFFNLSIRWLFLNFWNFTFRKGEDFTFKNILIKLITEYLKVYKAINNYSEILIWNFAILNSTMHMHLTHKLFLSHWNISGTDICIFDEFPGKINTMLI